MKYIGTNAIDLYGEEPRRREMPLNEYQDLNVSTNVKEIGPDVIDADVKPVPEGEPVPEGKGGRGRLDIASLLPLHNLNTNVSRGSTGIGNTGHVAPQTPYLIITRPNLSIPENYGHYYGYPSNMYLELGTLSGYTKVGDIHLDNIGCSKVEEGWLNMNLHGGFIIRDWSANPKPNIFTLYHNDSDVNVIGKDLTSLRTFATVKLKKATSMASPTFIVSDITDIVGNINYLYYPGFGRYYIVNDIVSLRNNLWAINCSTDVLETYKERLANLSGIIERQEENGKINLYLNDPYLKAYAKPLQRVIKFPNGFNDKGSSFIIVGAGRGSS